MDHPDPIYDLSYPLTDQGIITFAALEEVR